jgi:hypothetical protein
MTRHMTSNSRPVDAARIVTREIPVELIRDHPENYNFHPDEQVERLALSHNELGQYRSIVVWQQRDGTFMRVAGHGYSEGAQRAGATMLRCEVLPPDTPASTIKAIMLADNLHATGSEPDDQALVRLLEEQRDAGFNLEALGSSDDALRRMLDSLNDDQDAQPFSGNGGDEFEVDPDNVNVRCKRGDLWQLGDHRLLVDDSTKPENVKRLMGGEKAALMATDPPYGDSWVQKARDMQAHGYVHSHAVLHGSIENDDRNETDLKEFLKAFLEAAKLAGDPPMPFYVWHRAKRIIFETALVETGHFVHQPVVWVKPGFVIGRLHYHPRCEWALHGWRQGNGKCPFYGERNQSDVWEVARENDKIHPTQKPLELFCIPLRNHTQPGEICYEPFAGSGTCLIAAERERRRCYAMELDEKYASVILTRWEAESGQQATLIERAEEGKS